MKLFFATSNAAKVTSVARVLGRHGIEVERVDIDLPEPQAELAWQIAEKKVAFAYERLKAPVIVADSAFHIDSLNGFPGVYVKHATAQLGLQGYLDLLARFPEESQRVCRFIDAIAYEDGSSHEPFFAERSEEGWLATAPRGAMRETFKSPLAQLYVPKGHHKTLAEMTDEELAAYRSSPEMESYLERLAYNLLNPHACFTI